jgi:hypothetical protein
MSRNRQQLPFTHRPRNRARAVAIPQQDQRIVQMVVYALASAIIVLWMAYLSSVTGSVLARLGVVPSHLTMSETIDRAGKSDRLAATKFDERLNAVAETSGSLETPRHAERIPLGCEGAFMRLVKDGNFSTRCIA